jgi:hypothetical protein
MSEVEQGERRERKREVETVGLRVEGRAVWEKRLSEMGRCAMVEVGVGVGEGEEGGKWVRRRKAALCMRMGL